MSSRCPPLSGQVDRLSVAFVSHRRRGDDRWLEWKVRLFSVAAVLGLAGIYFEERRLTGAAILVLAGGILLRLIPLREPVDDGHARRDGDEGGADSVIEDGAVPSVQEEPGSGPSEA